jgi:DNA repair exonuclease SbcCD nuclease subunit
MAFRFIHTADWQIGKPFGNFPSETAFALKSERLRAVERIAVQARAGGADAVLIAGDAFDTNTVSDKMLVQTLEALRGFDGLWIFLPGNHDAAESHSVWTRLRAMSLPANVVIADEAAPLDLWGGRAIVLPAPLRRRRDAQDLTRWFDAAATPEGAIRVGLAHGSVANRLPGSSEASNEIAEDRADRAALNYLALGDWHGTLEIASRTYYSGTPEPDRHKANESGNIQFVAIDGPAASPTVERLKVGRFSWVQIEAELLDGTCAKALDALEALTNEPRDSVVALRLSGSISLAERRRLQTALTGWDARLHHLDIDDDALRDEPTPDDLDAIDTAGFVRLAVDRLKAKALDPADPERHAARMALRMVYLDHVGQDT